MPSIEDVLARIEEDASAEEPEVPDISEVLAALERDEREEAELEKAAEARADFFKLSEETTVVLPGPKQWWQEPVLRLDGPKFNFAAAGVLGKHEYLKAQPDYSPEEAAKRPAEDPKPPQGWFKSRPGLEDRLASAEVVRGAKRAARAAKASKASGSTTVPVAEGAAATEGTAAPPTAGAEPPGQ